MQAVLQFAVHLDTFRNIDLYSQGVYQFRFNIYAVKAKRALDKVPRKRAAVGLPLTKWAGERPLTQYLLAGDLCSRIEPVLGTFFSTGMRVQYCEQVVRLNEGATFQIAGTPAFHSSRSDGESVDLSCVLCFPIIPVDLLNLPHIYMDVDLYFCEYASKEYVICMPPGPVHKCCSWFNWI